VTEVDRLRRGRRALGGYDPRLVEVVDDLIREELEEARSRILRRIAEAVGVKPKT